MAFIIKKFTITWLIENYNFSFKPRGKCIQSPLLVIESVKPASWILQLYPQVSRKGHLVLRIESKGIEGECRFDFEVSFCTNSGSIPSFKESYSQTFSCKDVAAVLYVPYDKVYTIKSGALLPPKTLTITICCKIYKAEGSFSEMGQCFVRTRIRVVRTAFIGFVEYISCLIPNNNKKNLTIKSASAEKELFALNLILTGDLCCKERIWVEILPILQYEIEFCTCKLFLVDAEGKMTECGRSEILFDVKKPQEWKFPLYFTKGVLMKKKAQFLSNNTLTLKCEFAFCSGIEYERIEDSCFSDHAFVKENHLNLSCVSEDLTCLYEEGVLCDVKLQTETEIFNVHKSILSARSSVFKTMFTTDMREKINDCVVIEDMEADTVRRMLMFLYSDSLEEMDWELAKSLYFAADKYNIAALKYRCSEFLKSNFQLSNCCELLLLSDRHQDEDLKKSVQDYIVLNRDDVLHTQEWTNLENSNPALVIETFRIMCLGI